jgi:tetratricopeptide (TPR) repeat protein
MAYIGKGDLYMDYDLIQTIINYQKAESLIRDSKQFPILIRKIGFAFSCAGFYDKAKYYILEALKLDDDLIQFYLNSEIIEGLQGNYKKCIEYLEKAFAIDSTYITILKELGFWNLSAGKYDESLKYYIKYIEKLKIRGELAVNETHRIGYSFWKNGYKKEAKYYFDKQLEYCINDIKYGRQYATQRLAYYDMACVYAFFGDKNQAFKNLRIFKEKPVFNSWAVELIKRDPLLDSIRNEPEFQQIVRDVEAKYQAEHERVKKWLEEQGMF